MSEITIQVISIAITCFVNAFIFFNFMERIFSRVYRSKALYFVLFVATGIVLTASNLFEILIVNMFVSIALIFAIGIGLYGAKKSSDLLIMFLLYMFLALTELIGQAVLALMHSHPLSVSSGNITQSLITFFCYQVVMFFIARNKIDFNRTGSLIMLAAIPVISLFLLYTIMQILTEQSGSREVLFVSIGFILVFAINIIVFALFNRIAELNYKNEQLLLLEQQKQLQYRYFGDLERKHEETRKLFHDINNHLNTLEQLHRQEYSQAVGYADALRDKVNSLNYSQPTNNRILNILIIGRIEQAKSNNIEFNYNCEDIDLGFIADIDLNTILTNLLDNAFDECVSNRLGNNYIDLSICQINGFVIFNISNSCESPPQKKGSHYISKKEKHMGLGLENVRSTSEKYNGSIRIHYENHVFTVQITFPGHESDLPQLKQMSACDFA